MKVLLRSIRQIEAVTGTTALSVVQQANLQLSQICGLIRGSQRDQVYSRVEALNDNNRTLEKQIERLNQKLANSQSAELIEKVQDIAGVKTLIATLDQMDAKTLRNLHDSIKSQR